MVIPRYFEDPQMLHVHTEPNRAYYVPCACREEALAPEPRHTSRRFQLLNGEWQFAWYPSLYELDEGILRPGAKRSGLDTVSVPSVWQMLGYEPHQYTNVRYPFPYDPPYDLRRTPAGCISAPSAWRNSPQDSGNISTSRGSIPASMYGSTAS